MLPTVVPGSGRSPTSAAHRAHLTPVSTSGTPAGGSVPAGVGQALIKLLLTVAPGVAQGALAVMRVARVDTDA